MNALCGAEMRKRGRHRCRMHRYIYIYIPTRKYNRTTGPARVDLDYGVWNAKDRWHMQEQVPRHIFPRGAYRNDGLFLYWNTGATGFFPEKEKKAIKSSGPLG